MSNSMDDPDLKPLLLRRSPDLRGFRENWNKIYDELEKLAFV